MKNQTLISLTPWPPFWSKKFSDHFKNLTIYHFLVLNKCYICNKQSKRFQLLGLGFRVYSYVLWASLAWLYTCRNAKYPFIQTFTMLEPLHRMNEEHTNRSVKIERCEWVLRENRLCPKCQAMEISWFSHTHNNVVHICVHERILPSCLGRNLSSSALWMKGFIALFPFGFERQHCFYHELEGINQC